jgi:hypothetical protein
VAALLAATALAARAQSLPATFPVPAPAIAATAPVATAPQPRAEILKEIVDPSTGERWLLVRNAGDPAAPARLVLADGSQTSGGLEHRRSAAIRPAQPMAIRAGDALIVEQHSAVVDARLEAVALESAAPGTQFAARLKFGGKVVRVVAAAPGRAVLAPQSDTGNGAWR